MKLIIAFESVGVCCLQIIQKGNLNHWLNVKIPEGSSILEFLFDFEATAQDTFSVRLYPNPDPDQVAGGFTTVDFIVAIKAAQSQSGYFTD